MTQQEAKSQAALQKIKELSRPGQQIDIHEAIDLIFEIWAVANEATKIDEEVES